MICGPFDLFVGPVISISQSITKDDIVIMPQIKDSIRTHDNIFTETTTKIVFFQFMIHEYDIITIQTPSCICMCDKAFKRQTYVRKAVTIWFRWSLVIRNSANSFPMGQILDSNYMPDILISIYLVGKKPNMHIYQFTYDSSQSHTCTCTWKPCRKMLYPGQKQATNMVL